MGLNIRLIAGIKSYIEKKLSPEEIMPLNMQSSYVSMVLIGVCTLLLLVLGY